jgi:hypothetical protein
LNHWLLGVFVTLVALSVAGVASPVATAQDGSTHDQYLASALGSSGFPISDVVSLTEETDTNHLMGEPGGYVAKILWRDDRVQIQLADSSLSNGGSIEFFATPEDRAAREAYIASVVALFPILGDPSMANGRMLLRLSRDLTVAERRAYFDWFLNLPVPPE